MHGKDKRKQSGASKILAFLGILFDHARMNSWKLAVPQVNLIKIGKVISKKDKKPIPLQMVDDSEPPVKK